MSPSRCRAATPPTATPFGSLPSGLLPPAMMPPVAPAQREGAVHNPCALRRRDLARGVSLAVEAAASGPGDAPPAFSQIGACLTVLPSVSAWGGVGDAPDRPRRGCGAALLPAVPRRGCAMTTTPQRGGGRGGGGVRGAGTVDRLEFRKRVSYLKVWSLFWGLNAIWA